MAKMVLLVSVTLLVGVAEVVVVVVTVFEIVGGPVKYTAFATLSILSWEREKHEGHGHNDGTTEIQNKAHTVTVTCNFER
jgi:hypothetical protein